MPIQIRRHLIILSIVIVISFLLRQWLVPESFGDLGHYRANSLGDNELFEMHYAGQEACAECHEEEYDLKEMDMHFELACETCHGPSLVHTETNESVDVWIPETRDFCGLCHAINAARSKDIILQIDMNEHNPEENCTYCHNPHAPWELRDQDQAEENL